MRIRKSIEEENPSTEASNSQSLDDINNEKLPLSQPPPPDQQLSQPPIDDTFIPDLTTDNENSMQDDQYTSTSDANDETNISTQDKPKEKKSDATTPHKKKKSTKSTKKHTKKSDKKEKKLKEEPQADMIAGKPTPIKNLHKSKRDLKENDPIKEKVIENDKTPNPTDTEQSFSGQSDHQKDNKNDDQSQQDSILPIDAGKQLVNNTQDIQLSSFANMPSDVFQLFQKMVGIMTIEQNNGKNTTAITLSMPNSIFDKCELVLDHYDTAPHAYNVQLLGNPEAIAKFSKNMKNLNNAIAEKKLTFSINVLPPKLSKGYVDKIERKENPQEEDSEENGREQNG